MAVHKRGPRPGGDQPGQLGRGPSMLDRPGNEEIQLELFYSYGSNVPLYPQWQAYFREHQPKTLLMWGKNDEIFPAEGAHPYKSDLKNLEFCLLDTGHFALEEDGEVIANMILRFMAPPKHFFGYGLCPPDNTHAH